MGNFEEETVYLVKVINQGLSEFRLVEGNPDMKTAPSALGDGAEITRFTFPLSDNHYGFLVVALFINKKKKGYRILLQLSDEKFVTFPKEFDGRISTDCIFDFGKPEIVIALSKLGLIPASLSWKPENAAV